MRLLVGLGNPGREYRGTPHNVGFELIQEMRRRHGHSREIRQAGVAVSRAVDRVPELILARPLKYVNRSGPAVRAVLEQAGVEPNDLCVVCDDLNLDLGLLRLRAGGSHGGHNGLRSIIESLGTSAFPRLRIGIGPVENGMDHAEFVLAPFGAASRRLVPEIIRRAADCLDMAVDAGIEQAMSRYNSRPTVDQNEGP